jgi:hypothetical protein
VHNFSPRGEGGGPQSDETIRLGWNASFFYNLWEIALMSAEEQAAQPSKRPHANCTEIDMGHECGNGNCTLDSSKAQGFRCVCDAGFTGDDCENPVPLDCAAQSSRSGCENITGADADNGFQLYVTHYYPRTTARSIVPGCVSFRVRSGTKLCCAALRCAVLTVLTWLQSASCLSCAQAGLQMGHRELDLHQAR